MIKRETLEFLKNLKKNNNRDWFKQNQTIYRESLENIKDVTEYMIGEIAKFDVTLQGASVDECIFRIFRDTRFSRDKTPYKTNFGAFMKAGGRKTPGAGYYMHIEPGGSFLAGGVHMPPSEILTAIRKAIASNPDELKNILDEAGFVSEFGAIRGEKLKTAPKGFPRDHSEIELLKFKSYTVFREAEDEEVLSGSFAKKAIRTFMIMYPFNAYFNKVLGK